MCPRCWTRCALMTTVWFDVWGATEEFALRLCWFLYIKSRGPSCPRASSYWPLSFWVGPRLPTFILDFQTLTKMPQLSWDLKSLTSISPSFPCSPPGCPCWPRNCWTQFGAVRLDGVFKNIIRTSYLLRQLITGIITYLLLYFQSIPRQREEKRRHVSRFFIQLLSSSTLSAQLSWCRLSTYILEARVGDTLLRDP